MKHKATPVLSVAAVLGLLAGCGGGGGGSSYSTPAAANPAPGTPPAASAATIHVTSAGVSPREVRIEAGQTVTFVNDDTRSHEMMSDPHPTHTGCPEINRVGDLAPGASRQTATFAATRNCGFHDNRQDSVVALRGNIIIGDAGKPSDYY